MRAAFGLVGLLVVIGVIVWIMGAPGGYLDKTKADIDAGNKAKAQVNVIAGNSADGEYQFRKTITIDLATSGGKTEGLLVTSVNPAGPPATYYGLTKGDVVIDLGQMGPVKGQTWSADEALDWLDDAYRKQQRLTVIRNGQTITLPQTPTAAAAPANGKANNSNNNPLSQQLDALQKIPTH
jgi:uncharacterized protein (UPF0333 family)